MTNALPTVQQLVSSVAATEHTELDRVRAAVVMADDLGALGDEVVNHFVEAARGAGCSWSQIGAQLGVSKQAAQQAFVAPPRRRGRFGRRPDGTFGGRMGPTARAAIKGAFEEAKELGHDHVGTEHLLLTAGEGPGLAGVALRRLGVDQQAVRGHIADILGAPTTGSGHPHFTPRAKKVLELGVRESIRLHADRAGSEHLLLGLVREGEGVAAQILVQRLGLDLAQVRQAVLDVIQESAGETPAG
jgi:ATP-dependent Clp protease ATP-binding subunit ClpC